jgi:hypothetical protein
MPILIMDQMGGQWVEVRFREHGTGMMSHGVARVSVWLQGVQIIPASKPARGIIEVRFPRAFPPGNPR